MSSRGQPHGDALDAWLQAWAAQVVPSAYPALAEWLPVGPAPLPAATWRVLAGVCAGTRWRRFTDSRLLLRPRGGATHPMVGASPP